MPFRFPLAAVLLVRENAETREERALQKIQLAIARTIQQVAELDAAIANAHHAREQALQQPIPAHKLHAFLWQAQEAAEKKQTHLEHLQILEQERERQMKVYQAAHRDHEMLIEMSTVQRATYEQEQARTQQKRLDDIFIARRHRS